VRLLSVGEKEVGTAVFRELVAGTGVGRVEGRTNVVLNTCLKCGAQWAPGNNQTIKQMKGKKKGLPRQNMIFMVIAAILVVAWIAWYVYVVVKSRGRGSGSVRDVQTTEQPDGEGKAEAP
jgi:hypothetical protein